MESIDDHHLHREQSEEGIEGASWLGDETKKTALKKLDTMAVKPGWIDKPDSFTKDLKLVSIEDGGSLGGQPDGD
ncbi:MAG: hypothetical protein LBD02_07600 [Christensenellaceae bacterium]|nr:hypothetical protein [Christensenellaceae bacterium]